MMLVLPHAVSLAQRLVLLLVLLFFALLFFVLPATVAQAQEWLPQYYGKLNGQTHLLYAPPQPLLKPALGDIDNDGLPDLLVGRSNGQISVFVQRPPAGFVLVTPVLTHGTPLHPQGEQPLQVAGAAAPTLGDIDGDGDLDLLVGDAQGTLRFYRNRGSPSRFQLVQEGKTFLNLNLGRALVPLWADVNQDRALDLLLGTEAGALDLLINEGSTRKHRFCGSIPTTNPRTLTQRPSTCSPPPRRLIAAGRYRHLAPAFVDGDKDGHLDLLIGHTEGALLLYRQVQGRSQPAWEAAPTAILSPIDVGSRAAPAVWHHQGRTQLLIGNGAGMLTAYHQIPSAPSSLQDRSTATTEDLGGKVSGGKASVWQRELNVLRQAFLLQGSAQNGDQRGSQGLAAADTDGDGDNDLVHAANDGQLYWIENRGTPQEPDWRTRIPLDLPRQEDASPTLGDLDDDGDLDLLIGRRDGTLVFAENRGSSANPASRWLLRNTRYGDIDPGNTSRPLFVAGSPLSNRSEDARSPTLLVGHSSGQIHAYQGSTDDSTDSIRWTLASTSLGGITLEPSPTPAFIDWNGDGFTDLLAGGETLLLALRRRGGTWTDDASWLRMVPTTLGSQTISSQVAAPRATGAVRPSWAPHLADLNGDGRPDLLLSDRQGQLSLFLHQRPARLVVPALPQPPPAPPPKRAPVKRLSPPLPQRLTPRWLLTNATFAALRFDMRVIPTFGDIDHDGDLDLFLGLADGRLILLQNRGQAAKARWKQAWQRQLTNHRHLSPLLLDFNGTGSLDLLLGSARGIAWISDLSAASFQEGPLALQPLASSVPWEDNAAPAWHPSGFLLVGGLADGINLHILEGGASANSTFRLLQRGWLIPDHTLNASPFVGDTNGDGTLELLLGSDAGLVQAFTLTPTATGLTATPASPLISQKNPSWPPGSTPRLADIDNDGDMDLFVGSERGTIQFYRNWAVEDFRARTANP